MRAQKDCSLDPFLTVLYTSKHNIRNYRRDVIKDLYPSICIFIKNLQLIYMNIKLDEVKINLKFKLIKNKVNISIINSTFMELKYLFLCVCMYYRRVAA